MKHLKTNLNLSPETLSQVKQDYFLPWAVDYVQTPKGEPLDFYDHPYLIDIYDDQSKDIAIKKAAQIGISTYAINKSIWFADTHNVSIIYTMPTASDVADFSKARITPIVQASAYLRTRVTGGIELKEVGKSFIYFRGAWSERQAISVDSDFNIHDEIDFSKPDIIDMYRERMSHSKYGLSLTLSTPSIPEYGIDYLFQRSDKHEWFITCPSCGYEHILKYPDSIRGNTKEARYACVKCRATITDDDRRNGRWIATGDKDWNRRGYHISQLMAVWITATEILRKEEKSRIRPTKNLTGIRDFYNFVLGEAYGGDNVPLNRDIMLACIQNKYGWEEKGRSTVMGVDQGDKLHVVIYQKEKGLDKPRLIHAKIYDSFDVLPDLMDKYGVSICLIDALPNKHSARNFALRYPAKAWLVYYNENQKEFINWKKDIEKKEYRVVVNKIESFDNMAQRHRDLNIILPHLDSELDLYIRQMTNWAKDKEEDSRGVVKFVYKKLGADHFANASNYAMLGVDKLSTGSLSEHLSEALDKSLKPITSGILDNKF